MELLSTSLLLIIPTFLLFLQLIIRKQKQHPLQHAVSRLAPGPSNLPIIGSIHHLFGQKLPHHALRDLSAVYGPIMRMKLGEIHAIVISSAEAAREIMRSHDIAFASRPINTSTGALFYGGNGIAFGPYGEVWRQMRRLCFTELLSPKRVRSFRAVREEEVSYLIRSVAASSDAVVNLSSKLAETSNNVTARATIGDPCDYQKLFLTALEGVVELASGLKIVDFFPSMPFVGSITGFRRRLQKCQKKLDLMAEKIVQEHREKRAKCSSADDDEPLTEEDLTDVLLRIQRDGGLQFPLSNDNIKAVVNDMLLAGSETSATMMEWVMSELVRNPSVMRKAQREVRAVLGSRGKKEKIAEEEYLTSSRLTYLQLVIKETLRLHPPGPLLLPRENQESCEVMGYEIPAKTVRKFSPELPPEQTRSKTIKKTNTNTSDIRGKTLAGKNHGHTTRRIHSRFQERLQETYTRTSLQDPQKRRSPTFTEIYPGVPIVSTFLPLYRRRRHLHPFSAATISFGVTAITPVATSTPSLTAAQHSVPGRRSHAAARAYRGKRSHIWRNPKVLYI